MQAFAEKKLVEFGIKTKVRQDFSLANCLSKQVGRRRFVKFTLQPIAQY